MGDRVLDIRNLRCAYGDMLAVENASLHLDRGEIATILGPNGAGKTTLLKAITGAIKPVSGSIVYKGVDITHLDLYSRISMGIRYIPDRDSAFRTLSVEDNLRLVRKDYDISIFPILEKKLKVKAGYLSGGEYKILTLAMAYNSGAELLLIDEPSSGLFPKIKVEVAEILKNLRRRGVTMLIAEQDYEMAVSLGDRIYEMEAGLLRPSIISNK
ncbi:MAG: ATP-binding cassette domain-containing protein [Desulfurococcales archaeon]|jgi:branched-chain amino acid transport system ATP-binding protein|nr:ATP-binding cassette domain-containing protein [Desulfurococcales archaeon]